MTISNPTSQYLAYKVKTTAPKVYCVRPNANIVEPGETIDISIIRQPKRENEDSSSQKRHRDKFMVLTCPIPGEVPEDLTALWSQIEKDKPEGFQQKRITVQRSKSKGTTENSVQEESTVVSTSGDADIGAGAASNNGKPPIESPPAYTTSASQTTDQNSSVRGRNDADYSIADETKDFTTPAKAGKRQSTQSSTDPKESSARATTATSTNTPAEEVPPLSTTAILAVVLLAIFAYYFGKKLF